MAKKILIVGGAGYIGGALTDLLKKSQLNFTIYDNLTYENRYMKNVDFIYGDIRDIEKLNKIINNFDIVVWLAAIVGDGACSVDPEKTIMINEKSVKWLAENYNGKIIFTSTCSVYGANRNKNLTEISPTNPLSLYAGTKLNSEKYLIERGNSTIFRLGTLHGIGDNYARPRLDLVTNILCMKAVNGEKLTVFGGEQWRPIIHVKDVAKAIYNCLLEMPEWQNLNGVYNLASQNISINEIAKTIKKEIPECQISYQEMKFEDLRDYHVSINKLKHEIGSDNWTNYTLQQSIKELINVYKSNRIKDPTNSIFHNQKFMNEL